MLVIRLSRTGKTNEPKFRLVVAEKARAVKREFIEILGHYIPTTKKTFVFNKERIEKWISQGAHPSDSVASLLKRHGVENMERFITRQMDKKRLKKKEMPEQKAGGEDKKASQEASQKEQ